MAGNGEKTGGKVPSPESLTPEERAYYRDTWGFDPVSDKYPPLHGGDTSELEDPCLFYYQTDISLENDPDLGRTGIELYVRVFHYMRGECICTITFYRGEKKDEIHEIFSDIGRDFEELLVQALSDKMPALDKDTVKKIPWVRFAALKSLVQGWAKNGFLNGITHLNPYFYTRILEGLHQVAGIFLLLNKYIFRLIEELPPKWFADRWMLWTDGGRELEKIYSLKNNIFNNFPFLKSLEVTTRIKWLKILLALSRREEQGEVLKEYSPDILWLAITEDSVDSLDAATVGESWGLVDGYLGLTDSYVRLQIYSEVPRLLEVARLLLQSGLKRKLNVGCHSHSFTFENLKIIEEDWKPLQREEIRSKRRIKRVGAMPESKVTEGSKGGSRASELKVLHPEGLSYEEREYYREAWGFDPVKEKKVSPPHPDIVYFYEASIPLENDPELGSAGVAMRARVEVDAHGKSHNRIVFTRGEKSVSVACVHTAVHAAPVREISEISEEKLKRLAASTEVRPVILPPWEHFAALKSFAGGLAAAGILWPIDQIPTIELKNYLLLWSVGIGHLSDLKNEKPNSMELPISLELMGQILAVVFALVPELLQSIGVDTLIAIGTQLVHYGHEKRAILFLEYATHVDPKNVNAWYYLSLAYFEVGSHPQAIHAFEQTLKLNPEHAEAWLNLGSARITNGDKQGSREAFARWKDLTGSPLPHTD